MDFIAFFRACRCARIKTYFSRILLPAVFAAAVGSSGLFMSPSSAQAQGAAMQGILGMFGGFSQGAYNMWGPQCYASGQNAYTPWYTQGSCSPMMMGGCMSPYYCGGFPQIRPPVYYPRPSCTSVVCRTPTPSRGGGGGGGGTTTLPDAPTMDSSRPQPPVVKKPPRVFVPPAVPPREPPKEIPIITEEPPPIDIPLVVPVPLPGDPIVAAPPPAKPPEPLPPTRPAPPPVKQEGSFSEVNPSRRCMERRKDYTTRMSSKKTEGEACPDPTGEACKEFRSSGVLQILSNAGIDTSAAGPAESVLAQVYQDCRVLDIDNVICSGNDASKMHGVTVTVQNGALQRKVEGGGSINHEYFQEICTETEMKKRSSHCNLVCTNPALFNWGGKPNLIVGADGSYTLDLDSTGGLNKIVVDGREKQSGRGLDCTGAVSAFMLAGGRLMKPLKSQAQLKDKIGSRIGQVHHMHTSELISAGDKAETCFEAVRLEKDKPLLPGDVISRNEHTMMIERLDTGWENDPFGMGCWGQELDIKGNCANRKTGDDLDKIDCKNASAEYFRFDLIQSAGMDSKGMIRIPAYDFFAPSCETYSKTKCDKTAEDGKCIQRPCEKFGGGADTITGNMMKVLAIEHCNARKSNSAGPKASVGKSLGIIRHDDKKAGCMLPKPPKLKNDDCVNCKKTGGV